MPGAVAIGDFNQDGRPDLAVANSGSNTISILLGNADGSFQAAVNYSVGQDPVSIAVVDLNLDHKLDLAVAFHGDPSTAHPGGISLLLGNGDGTFPSATTLAGIDYPTGIAAGDFNGDGRPDLAISNIDGPVTVFLGNGNGTFQSAVNYDVTGDVASITVGDFNGDGKPDLALTTHINVDTDGLDGKASVLLGKGDGSFQPAVETSLGGAATSGAAADFNGDGKLDLAFVLKPNDVFGVPTEAIALGNGDGTFQSPQSGTGGAFTSWLGVSDINQDGSADLVGLDAGVLHIFLGQGNGTFQPPQTVFSSSGAIVAAIGDLNGDGLPDFAVALSSQNVVSVLLNTTSDFAIALSPLTPAAVTAGQSAASTVTTTAGNGFTGMVSLSCSVQPSPSLAPKCSMSPSSVSPGTPATLMIVTSAPRVALAAPAGNSRLLYAVWMPVFGGALAIIGFRTPWNKRRTRGLLVWSVVLAGSLLESACGGGGATFSTTGSGTSSGTPTGQYTVTVTGSAGSTQHSARVTLTVQ